MALYKAILAYDGTDYSGFQRQAEERTVQGEVEAALRRIGWNGTTIYGAGRTDAGVHAAGQVISFDMTWSHPTADLQNALNASLPRDASVRSLDVADPDFHPRHAAVRRKYVYRLVFDPEPDPLNERYAWRLWPALALDQLEACAGIFIGAHDFSGFGRATNPGGPTVRVVFTSEWKPTENGAEYAISGNAFLFRMVRRIVYGQVEAARGKLSIETLRNYLSGEITGMVQGLAPARGLVLESVSY
jgi:tRNA pseudouridine38-40 synthase